MNRKFHGLTLWSLRDLHATCSCGEWSYARTTTEDEKDEALRATIKEEFQRHYRFHVDATMKELGFEQERQDLNDFTYVAEGEGGDGIKMGRVTIAQRMPKLDDERPLPLFDDPVTVVFTDGDGQDLLTLQYNTLDEFLNHAEAE